MQVAQEREIPVMMFSWIEAVWDAMGGMASSSVGSESCGMLATDQQFLSHVCPVFFKQVVCVSQLPKKEKNSIKKLVEENGGTYSPALDMNTTTLLVLLSPDGDKYKAALEWNIKCVSPEFVYDSIQAGYALNPSNYKCKVRGSSTPTKGNKMPPPDVSMCSTIANETFNQVPLANVNETAQGDNTLVAMSHPGKSLHPVTNGKILAGVRAIDELSLSEVASCPSALDSCKVYLSGWAEGGATLGSARAEKLRKLLNLGGATRFNQLTEAATHIIFGKSQIIATSNIFNNSLIYF